MSGTVIYDHTLGSDAASIDTGAGAIPAGYASLQVLLIGRTADAGASGLVSLTFNGDTGANYDDQNAYGTNGSTLSGSGHNAGGATGTILHGSGGTANYPGVWVIDLPGYDQTTFYKTGTFTAGIPDGSAGNQFAVVEEIGWRSTAAINQITVTGTNANLKAGTRLVVIGVGSSNDKKISDLSDGGAVQATDEFVVSRSGANERIAGAHIPGFELDYAQITADVSVSGSSGSPTSVIDGNAVTYDGSTRIKIEFFTAQLASGSQALIVQPYRDSTGLDRLAQMGPGLTTPGGTFTFFDTPSAGSHTYHIKAWVNGGTAGIITAVSGTYQPAYQRITVA